MELLPKMPADALEAGIFLVDKPVGPSSFRMVQLVRRALSIKKVGHAGTLDPFASGLLIICVGRPATRLISQFMDGTKRYEAVLRLGIETTTQDLEGEITAQKEVGLLAREELVHCLAGFVGEQLQTPPQYSALKHLGKPLYHYARKGITIEKAPRLITIFQLQLLEAGPDNLCIVTDHGANPQRPNNHGISGHRVPQVAAHPEGISFARADKLPSSAISGTAMRTFVREPDRSPQDVVPCDRLLRIMVECSKGTYIRTLAADIGRALGCGAHLAALRRLQSGPFTVDQAVDGAMLQDSALARQALLAKALTVEEVLAMLPGQE